MVSNKESVEVRAKPEFYFQQFVYFRFPESRFKRKYNNNGYSLHKQAIAKMLTSDRENLIVQVTSIIYYSKHNNIRE